MPRVYIAWNIGERDQESDPLDYCSGCWAPEAEDLEEKYSGTLTKAEIQEQVEDALDASGHEHPPYDECEYDCESCGARLTGSDDYA